MPRRLLCSARYADSLGNDKDYKMMKQGPLLPHSRRPLGYGLILSRRVRDLCLTLGLTLGVVTERPAAAAAAAALVPLQIPACPSAAPIGWSSEQLQEVYAAGMAQWCAAVHAKTQLHRGYLCKEMQGKFMLCFVSLADAISFSVSLQGHLLTEVAWDPQLLCLEDFAVCVGRDGSEIRRGITPAIGMSWGQPTSRRPMQTSGRADYFGPVVNRAARCMAAAAYGQVIVDGEDLHRLLQPCHGSFPKLDTPLPENGLTRSFRKSFRKRGYQVGLLLLYVFVHVRVRVRVCVCVCVMRGRERERETACMYVSS